MPVTIGSQTNVPDTGDPITSPWPKDTATKLVHQFANTTARDTWASPPDGAMCVTIDADRLWQRKGAAWVEILDAGDVDARVTAVGDPRYVNIGGDTMTGTLEFGGNPSSASPALWVGQTTGRIFSSINDATGGSVRLKHISPASVTYVNFEWGGTTIGSIARNGSNNGVLYNTTSDGRYKHVDADVDPDDAADTVRQLHVVRYRWKMSGEGDAAAVDENGAPTGDPETGLIAQEAADLIPDAVTPANAEQPMWQIDYGRITPTLIAALQAAFDRIDALTARITELEAA